MPNYSCSNRTNKEPKNTCGKRKKKVVYKAPRNPYEELNNAFNIISEILSETKLTLKGVSAPS